MLGKLFKYEFKNTAKVMLTIYAVLVAVTLIGMSVLSIDSIRNGSGTFANAVLVSLMIIYILSVFAMFIVTYVYVIIHFYKSMYSAQGYLTHTLPVSPMANFNVKLLTSLVWMFASLLLVFLSIFGFVSAAAGPEIWNAFNFQEINSELQSVFGITLPSLIGTWIIGMLVSCLAFLMMVYVSCSIGQLFHQYKVVASIVTGIILYFVQEIISVIYLFVIGFNNITEIDNMSSESATVNISMNYSSSIWLGIAFSLFFIIVYYIVCSIIVRKHLNLE